MASTATPPTPILDLTTDRPRPVIKIDRQRYELRTPDDLTLYEYKQLEALLPRIADMLLLDTLTEAEGEDLSQMLERACRLALLAPDAVHARLKDVTRVQIFEAFTERLAPSLPGPSAKPEANPSVGAKSSPVSPGSTAGSRRRGSRKSH